MAGARVRSRSSEPGTPELGRSGRWPRTRELVVPPYVVVYQQDEAAVDILAVHHSARRWPDDMPDLIGN